VQLPVRGIFSSSSLRYLVFAALIVFRGWSVYLLPRGVAAFDQGKVAIEQTCRKSFSGILVTPTGSNRRILGQVSVEWSTDSPRCVRRQELRDSGARDPILLNKDLVDRVVVNRMDLCSSGMEDSHQPWPLFYLMGAWSRAADLRNRVQDPHKEAVLEALRTTKEILANYAVLVLLNVLEQVQILLNSLFYVACLGRVCLPACLAFSGLVLPMPNGSDVVIKALCCWLLLRPWLLPRLCCLVDCKFLSLVFELRIQ
jgi:hypothetical protein